MVLTMDPETVRSEAVAFFRQSELPASLGWAADLSPVNLRLFAVELADAIKEATITGRFDDMPVLLSDWQATAELDAAPDVLAEVRRPKVGFPVSEFIKA